MYRLIYLAYLLMVASAGVTFVFLEDVETEFGLPAWGVGLIAALGFFTAVIASLGISPLGDRGHLRLLGWLGFATAIGGNILFGLAGGLFTLTLSRALTGIGIGLFAIVARKALIGEATDDSGEKLGQLISAAVAGFIAGPVLGSQLAEFGGMATPYYVLAVLLALVAIPTMSWVASVPVAISESVDTGAMGSLLRLPGIRAAVAAQVAVFFNIGVFDATADEYLTNLGVSNAGVGLAIAIVGLPLLVIPRLVGRYVDKSPRPADVMIIALAFFVPIVVTIGFWEGVAVFVVLATIQTCLESTLFPAAARVVVNETGAEKSAIGTGLLDAAGSLAGGISAFIAPITFDLAGGPSGSFGISGAFAGLMLIIVWHNVRQRDETQTAVPHPAKT